MVSYIAGSSNGGPVLARFFSFVSPATSISFSAAPIGYGNVAVMKLQTESVVTPILLHILITKPTSRIGLSVRVNLVVSGLPPTLQNDVPDPLQDFQNRDERHTSVET